MRYIRAQVGISGDHTPAYVRRAIRAGRHVETGIMEFNDGWHSYEEIAAVANLPWPMCPAVIPGTGHQYDQNPSRVSGNIGKTPGIGAFFVW
jgi:hypothetical protein